MQILCADIGFGHNKVTLGDESSISHLFKFPSVIAKVQVNELVKDDRVYTVDGESYYVGEDALALQSNSIVDINTYALLEFSAPLFISKMMNDIGVIPDVLVLGLSIAQIKNSAHFKSRVEDFLKSAGMKIRVMLLPQGMIAKMTIDKYADNFPSDSTQFGKYQNYIGVDIGFNTLDIFQVIGGKTSSNLVRGIPERGVQVIVAGLVMDIQKAGGPKLSMSEGKKCLDNGSYRVRGKDHDCADLIAKHTKQYIDDLMIIIENEFGEVLDKSDSMFLFGGGSYALKSLTNDFVKVPKEKAEYYNAIAYYLYAVRQVLENK